jgi:hypothetical protein
MKGLISEQEAQFLIEEYLPEFRAKMGGMERLI